MKEELEQIANKHNMELKEVVVVAKELLEKIKEEMAEFEVGDTVMTPKGPGEIVKVLHRNIPAIETEYFIDVYVDGEGFLAPVYEKRLLKYKKSEIKKTKLK